MSRRIHAVATLSFVCTCFTLVSHAQSIRWLPNMDSRAHAISADGSTVIGIYSAFAGNSGFHWSNSNTVNEIQLPAEFFGSNPMAVSADGSIVVGSMWHSSGIARAFRWETFQEAQDLGVMAGGVHSEATGISANGSVIVGYDTTNSDQSVLSRRAFLWTSGTMTPLSTLSGYIGSEVTAVSADGSIVGACYDASGNARAVLWTSPTQVTDLGTLGGAASRANAISADGTTIVGWAMTNAAVGHAFLWRAGQGMQDLGTLPNGFSSTATSVSADGSAVVGIDYVLINPMVLVPRAVRWLTSAGTIEELTMTFAPWLNNSRLMEATGISADGNAIVGYGLNTATGNLEAYWLKKTTPGDVTGDGCVNDIDVLNVLFAYGQTGPNLPEDLNRDGIIDDADLLEVLFNFGNGC